MERTIQQYVKKIENKMRHTTPDGLLWMRTATGHWLAFGTPGKTLIETDTDEGLAKHHINAIPTVK